MQLKYYTDTQPAIALDDIVAAEAVSGSSQWRVTINVQEDDSSYRYRALMEVTQLVLKFSLPRYIDFPIGTFCDYMGQRFTLTCPADFKKQGSRNYEYSLIMYAGASCLDDYKLRNVQDGRLKWSMCARPREFLDQIVANLNERSPWGDWSVGANCLDATEKTIEFNHSTIADALSSVASEFDTEYEISDERVITLRKVEYLKDNPLELAYGRGNGFVPGVGRTSQTDEKPVKRLYVQGGDRNINRSEYGAPELLLPIAQTLQFDGEHFDTDLDDAGQPQINAAEAHTYASSADGTFITRTDVESDALREDSIDCSEIYPSRVGHVTSVVTVNAGKNFYDIVDSSIPDDLDFEDCLIPGEEKMTIIFQSGMLAGKEFEAKYKHADKRFEIVPQEIDGEMMPNETYLPSAANGGDEYAVFGVQLPPAYICNNATKTGASWDMFREAARWLYEHEEQKFTFAGELQGMWAKQRWSEISPYMRVGAYIRFKDEHFATGDGVIIRIVGIKDYLTKPYAPQIEISNTASAASTTGQQLRELDRTEVAIDDAKRDALSFTRRRFNDAKETSAMLEAAINSLADGYTEAISPISVKTMQMLAGDEGLQFEFITSLANTTRLPDPFRYDATHDKLYTSGTTYIRHLALGITDLSATHNAEDYLRWAITEANFVDLDPGKGYYIYAVVRKPAAATQTDGERTGYFQASEIALTLEGRAGFIDCYHLLCGILNKRHDGTRSYVPLYGFTEILPGRITTDRVVSSDGASYFDLANNAFSLGSCDANAPGLQFNTDGSGQFVLHGTLVQSPAGDTAHLPCFRGAWDAGQYYFPGDVVTYGTPATSYICIAQNISMPPGVALSADKWSVYAECGEQGQSPALVFRGEYDTTAVYYGNYRRLDCVRFGSTYYVARMRITSGEDGGFSSHAPTDTNYWSPFGASFDSVATGLLLAEMANIGGWIFKDNRLISQVGTDGSGNYSEDFAADGFTPAITLDATTGEIWQGDNILINADGVTLYDDSRNVAAKIVNSKIGSEAELADVNVSNGRTDAITGDNVQLHCPAEGVTYTTILYRSFNLGFFGNGSTIKMRQADASFNAPSYSGSGTLALSVTMRLLLMRGSTVVQTVEFLTAYEAVAGDAIPASWSAGADTVNINGSGNRLPGEYSMQLQIIIRHTINGGSGTSGFFSPTVHFNYDYKKAGANKTLIGTDGMYSRWGNAYIFANAGGITLRHGNNGLRVSGAGVKKTIGGDDFYTDV